MAQAMVLEILHTFRKSSLLLEAYLGAGGTIFTLLNEGRRLRLYAR